MSKVVLNIHVDGESKEPLQLELISDNAQSILNRINEELFVLKNKRILTQNMVLDKAVATPKPEPGFFDFDYFKSEPKSEPVDLVKLHKMIGSDNLKNLSVEPTIDVYFKTPLGGRKTRKSRKNRKSRKR